MYKKSNILAAAMVALLVGAPAYAVQFDGFLTAGAAWHDDKNKNRYIGSLGDRGVQDSTSFETDSRFGLQISSDVAEDMSVTAQILGTGVNGDFDAIIEWAYVDYELSNWLSVRGGKLKQPVFLVNDYAEVGYAYPWIRPPVEVYYLNNPLNTVNGIEFLFQFKVGPGTLSLQPYFGTNRSGIPNTDGQGYYETERIRGMDIKYAGHAYSAHVSSFQCGNVKIYGNLTNQPSGFGAVNINLGNTDGSPQEGPCKVNSVGFNLDISNIVVYSEYQERFTKYGLSKPFGDQDAFYTTLGYRFGKWLPHITYAAIDGKPSTFEAGTPAVTCASTTTAGPCMAGPGTALMNFPVSIQTSITYGLRYELNDSAALKIEHSVVDVENDPSKIDHPFNINFGLFDTSFTNPSPTEKVGVTSIALDVIF